MKKLPLIAVALSAFASASSFADLTIGCEVHSAGRVVGFCRARVSGTSGTGEAKLAPGASLRFSTLENCPVEDYDLLVENVARAPKKSKKRRSEIDALILAAASSFSSDTFKISVVAESGRKKKLKSKNYGTFEDPRTVQIRIGGSVGYLANGSGLQCSVTNQ